jgi:hypothetical protein
VGKLHSFGAVARGMAILRPRMIKDKVASTTTFTDMFDIDPKTAAVPSGCHSRAKEPRNVGEFMGFGRIFLVLGAIVCAGWSGSEFGSI